MMSKELVGTMLEALIVMVDGLRTTLPPNFVEEGDWLDTMDHMEDPVALAEAAIEEAMTFLEGEEE